MEPLGGGGVGNGQGHRRTASEYRYARLNTDPEGEHRHSLSMSTTRSQPRASSPLRAFAQLSPPSADQSTSSSGLHHPSPNNTPFVQPSAPPSHLRSLSLPFLQSTVISSREEDSSDNIAATTPVNTVTHRPSSYTTTPPVNHRRQCAEIWGAFTLLVRYIHTGTIKNKRNYRSFAIGLATVFLVVMFLSLVQNALVRSSVIFVKISEDMVGQCDLLITPSPTTRASLADTSSTTNINDTSSSSSLPLLNFTHIYNTLSSVQSVAGAVPRWLIPANVSKRADTIESIQQELDSGNSSSSIAAHSAAFLLIMDNVLELEAEIGTAWPFRTLGENEAHVTGSMLRALRCRPNSGDMITIQIDLTQMLNSLGASSADNLSSTVTAGNTTSPRISSNGQQANVVLTPTEFDQLTFITNSNRTQLQSQSTRDSQGNYVFDAAVLAPIFGIDDLYTLKQDFVIVDAINSPYTKYPKSIGNVIVLDSRPTELLVKRRLLELLANPLYRIIAPSLNLPVNSSQISLFKLNDYAMSVVLTKSDRLNTYIKGSTERQQDFIQFSNDVVEALGISYPANYLDALNQALGAAQFIQIFMNEIFFTVIAILALLAVLLIYSLLISDVEEKTFEYGMLRSLGLRQDNLIGLLVIQSLYFSIPGTLLGLLVCFILYIPIEHVISNYANVPFHLEFSTSAWLLGLLLGLLLPVLGMMVPIRRALSKTLRDALDVYHNAVFDSIVTIQRLENLGVSLNETLFAILLIVIGFLVYYVVPLAFTFNNLALFFRILTVILLGMVIGQTLLAQIVQHALEFVALKLLFLIGPDRHLVDIVAKNLGGHIQRNRKTALMFTLCLAYIIFAAAMFTLQTDSLSQTIEWTYGADIVVNGRDFMHPLPETRLRAYFNLTSASSLSSDLPQGLVEDHTFVSYDLSSYLPIASLRIGGLAAITRPDIKLYGIEDNFLNVALEQYYMPTELDSQVVSPLSNRDTDIPRTRSGRQNPVSYLADYVDPARGRHITVPSGITVSPIVPSFSLPTTAPIENLTYIYSHAIPLLISNSLQTAAYLTIDSVCPLDIEYKPLNAVWTSTKTYLTKPIAILSKLPYFSGISRLNTQKTPVLTSMHFYKYLLDQIDIAANTSVKSLTSSPLPKGGLLVRLRQDATMLQIEALINDINTLVNDEKVTVHNLRDQLQTTQSAAKLITILFNIVALVGVILSFFVLWLSFTANIKENAWEYGVLRAIGLDSGAVTRIYIYEALCIIFATIVLGTIIGIVTAVTLTLQFNLFTEMPFNFNFPVTLFSSVVAMSLIVAVIGSFLPANSFRKKQIASVLKGQ